MHNRVDKILKSHWEQMVDGMYFYRGMSLKNINLESDIALDSSQNPHESIIPIFTEYSEMLFRLIEAGLEFNVNDFYIEPLHKVLTWTVRDIKNPGVDFTTNYADATSYAFNHAGSQIKHNFNLIVHSIQEHKNHKSFDSIEQARFWKITEKIKEHLVNDNATQHQPVVVKVRRSCKSFEAVNLAELNVGSFEFFYQRARHEAITNDVFNVDKITFFLHQKSQTGNFNIRMISPLGKNDIEDVIKL